MPAELFKVKLSRENTGDKWGFSLAGGKDQLLVISEVRLSYFDDALTKYDDIYAVQSETLTFKI